MGTALGLYGCLGNQGVSIGQFLTPLVLGGALFGSLSGVQHLTAAGGFLYFQNGALVWVPVSVVPAAA